MSPTNDATHTNNTTAHRAPEHRRRCATRPHREGGCAQSQLTVTMSGGA